MANTKRLSQVVIVIIARALRGRQIINLAADGLLKAFNIHSKNNLSTSLAIRSSRGKALFGEIQPTDNRGSALVAAIIISLGMLIGILILLYSLSSSKLVQKNTSVYSTATIIRNNTANLLLSQSIWERTKIRGMPDSNGLVLSTLAPSNCLARCGACAGPIPGGPALAGAPAAIPISVSNRFLIPNPDPTIAMPFVKPIVAGDPAPQGFDLSGSPCLIADVTGDDACPFQVNIYWQQDNAVDACGAIPPQVPNAILDIFIDITYLPKSEGKKVNINATSSKFANQAIQDNFFVIRRPY